MMEIKPIEVTVGEVCEGYFNDAEEGDTDLFALDNPVEDGDDAGDDFDDLGE